MQSQTNGEKSLSQMVEETLSDLKRPKKWLDYFEHAIKMLFSFAKSLLSPIGFAVHNHPKIGWQTAVIIIAVIFILAVIFKLV